MTEKAKNYNPFNSRRGIEHNASSTNNPFHEAPVDSQFKIKRSLKERFFHGAKATAKGLKTAGKGTLVIGHATKRGVFAAAKISSAAKTKLYNARALSLERQQNISTYKANIASQKQLKTQQRTVVQESKLKQLELKQQRRDFLRQQHQARSARSYSDISGPPKAQFFKNKNRAPLGDRPIKNKPNLNKSSGAFFSGNSGIASRKKQTPQYKVKGLSDKGNAFKVNLKGRKKGGFFR